MTEKTKTTENEKVEKENNIEEAVKKDIKKAVEAKKSEIKKSKPLKKEETKTLEREYIIPLREKCRSVPRYKKTNKAIKTVKEFLVRHMKIRDRDLKKIKLDTYLNEALWSRGIRSPPSKIKVKAVKEGDIVKVELVDMSKKLESKRLREEKREKKAMEVIEKKTKKIKEDVKKEEPKKLEDEKSSEKVQTLPDKKIEQEKKSAVVEAGKELGKAAAKKAKHTAKGSEKSPVVQRKALAR